MSQHEIAHIRLRSAQLHRFVTGLLLALCLLWLLERFSATGLRVFMQAGSASSLYALAARIVAAVPELCYLLALAGVRRALGEFAKGQLYAATVTHMLGRVGLWLAAGAFTNVFVVPAVQTVLGDGPGYWIAFDVSGLVLGALGLTLTIVARVLGSAAALKAELDEIF